MITTNNNELKIGCTTTKDAIVSYPKEKTAMSRPRSLVIIILIICLTFALIMALQATKETVRSAPVEEKRWQVKTQRIQYQSYKPSLTVFGKIQSPAFSTLTSNVTGIIEQTPVLDGQLVTAGETLIRINPTESQRKLDQRRADLQESKATLASEQTKHQYALKALAYEQKLLALSTKAVNRRQTLKNKNLSADSDLESALMAETQQAIKVSQMEQQINNHPNQINLLEARVLRTDALFQQAKDDLASTNVTAPFNGRVSTLHISKGDRASQGSALLSLYSTQELEFRVLIPTPTVNRIRSQLNAYGQTADHIHAIIETAGQRYELAFDRLAGEVKSGSSGLEAIFKLPSHQDTNIQALPIGKTLSAQLQLPAIEKTIAVPASSIYKDKFVYRVIEGQLHSVPIHRLGYWQNAKADAQSFWIIQGNLKDGDQILTSLLPNAIDGLKVEPHE